MGVGKKMQQKILSIQVVRAIAFILVFLSHVELISTGPLGVSLFLVLSGFCMTYSYLDRPEKIPQPCFLNNLRFAWGKIKKLYPLHFVTLLFVALIVFGGLFINRGPIKEIAEQSVYFIANSLLLQSWIPCRDGYYSFNAVSWYLSTSAFSYFLFPWVFRFIQSKDKKKIVTLTSVTLGLMVMIAFTLEIGQSCYGITREFVKWAVYIFPFYRSGDFIIGLLTGYFFVTNKKPDGKVQQTFAQIVILCMTCAVIFAYNEDLLRSTSFALDLIWLPLSVACIYLFGINEGRLSKVLSSSKWPIMIGNVSGEAFLVHHICID